MIREFTTAKKAGYRNIDSARCPMWVYLKRKIKR